MESLSKQPPLVNARRVWCDRGGFGVIHDVNQHNATWPSGAPAVGQRARRTRTVDARDIALCTEISGDRNPIHYDDELASRTRFGGIVVQGGIITAILNAVVAEDLPGPGTVFLHVDWKFKAPVRPGDVITGEVEITRSRQETPMAYGIAGIDVHKKMVAVAIADVEVAETWQFERRQMGTTPNQLRALAEWLVQREVDEVVMESTAQYWRPVWEALERGWRPRRRQGGRSRAGALHLAQAQSNEGPRGRKRDFPDAERLVKRLVAQELTLSFVPDVTQRLWRTVARRKYQATCNRVQLQNRLECLLEEMHIKLSSLVADLIGPSARRMLRAIAGGETDVAAVAALGSRRLHATPDQLRDALGACTDLHPVYRRLLALTLDELAGICAI